MPPAPSRADRRQRTLRGPLAPGKTFAGVVHLISWIAVAGAKTIRIRAKVTGAAATIAFFFRRPGGARYGSDNPANLVLADGVEDMVDIACGGEEELELDLLGAGAGVIGFIDVMQAPNG